MYVPCSMSPNALASYHKHSLVRVFRLKSFCINEYIEYACMIYVPLHCFLQRCATPPFARIMELVVKLSSTTKTPSLVHVLLGGQVLPVLMTLMNVLKTLVKMEANV